MAQKAEKQNQSRIWTIIAGIGLFLLSKLKWVFSLLKLGKFATLISMFISLGAYAAFYGWKFAVAIVYLIFVHEMGHLVAAKQKGIKTSPAIFIPFMGAAIGMKEMPKNAKDEAYIAYAGPLFGLLSFLPAVFLYETTKEPFWGLVIFLGAMINLFNLFPVSPLDGGRIVGVLSTKIWFIGLLLVIPYLFISPDPIIFLIFIFGILTWWKRVREDFEQNKLKETLTLFQSEQDKLTVINQEMDEYKDMPNFGYIIGTYLEDVRVAKDRLKRNMPTGYSFPVLQDKKKIRKHRTLVEIEILNNRERFLQTLLKEYESNQRQREYIHNMYQEADPQEMATIPELPNFSHSNLFEAYEQSLLAEKAKTEKQFEQTKNYYVSNTKTKVIVLIMYLLLAGVLSAFVVYGNQLMDANRFLIS
ncbi:site-2 protease family protein [Fictibacillus nanhaiensis]|uniref:Site-2 protease family protein n=1 Tax=Fictibacillus nanhaiensis TaxID=742169 RepID=A0ABS2ZPE6_9BACL|nr:site-2 protease family protein [Fictibacillus nanhaiensis]